jgi:hypothetical protein
MKACGELCKGKTRIETGIGVMAENSTAGVCVTFDFVPPDVRPDRFVIIDKYFWYKPYNNHEANDDEIEGMRYRLIAHEILGHCVLDLGHRKGDGLMAFGMKPVRDMEEVDKLITEELNYFKSGGEYDSRNYDQL